MSLGDHQAGLPVPARDAARETAALQAPILRLEHASYWRGTQLHDRARFARNEALNSLIEFGKLFWQAGAYTRGTSRLMQLTHDLNDVTLDIPSGAIVGVLDTDGLARAAFLGLAGRAEAPRDGHVSFYGEVASTDQLSAIPLPYADCLINLTEYARLLGFDRDRAYRAAEQAAEASRLEQFATLPFRRVPKNIYRDLSTAFLVFLKPDILVMDEFFRAESERVQELWLDTLPDFAAEGRTLIATSRRPVEFLSHCTNLVVFDGGKAAAVGAVDKLLETHAELVATAIQTKPIVLNRAEFVEDDDDDEDEDIDELEVSERDELTGPDTAADHWPDRGNRADEADLRRKLLRVAMKSGIDSAESHERLDYQPFVTTTSERLRFAGGDSGIRIERADGSPATPVESTDFMPARAAALPVLFAEDGGTLRLKVETFEPNLRLRFGIDLRWKKKISVARCVAPWNVVMPRPGMCEAAVRVPPHWLMTMPYSVGCFVEALGPQEQARGLVLEPLATTFHGLPKDRDTAVAHYRPDSDRGEYVFGIDHPWEIEQGGTAGPLTLGRFSAPVVSEPGSPRLMSGRPRRGPYPSNEVIPVACPVMLTEPAAGLNGHLDILIYGVAILRLRLRDQGTTLPAGSHTLRLEIPAHLLAEHNYQFRLELRGEGMDEPAVSIGHLPVGHKVTTRPFHWFETAKPQALLQPDWEWTTTGQIESHGLNDAGERP